MGYEGQDFDEIASGVSPGFVETLYRVFQTSPDTVEPAWRSWFEGLEASSSGPSWAKSNWPLPDTDALTAALDPMQMAIPPKPDAKKPAPATVSYQGCAKYRYPAGLAAATGSQCYRNG